MILHFVIELVYKIIVANGLRRLSRRSKEES